MSQQDVYLVEELRKNKIEDNFRLLQGCGLDHSLFLMQLKAKNKGYQYMDTPYFGLMINIIGCCGHHIYAHEIDICMKRLDINMWKLV